MSASKGILHPLFRKLGLDDVAALVEIEETAYQFPWTAGIFSDCIRVGYSCQGVCLGPQLVGYSVQNWAAGESHLLNLCVHPSWQKRGFGNLLLDDCIAQAIRQQCGVMLLEVRPSNDYASKVYARKGFKVIGRRPAYYESFHGREDALVMQLDLNPAY